ncbi:MAG: class I SAM-dependent methyltransferase [Lapillicoccus sp.]
MTSNEPDYVSLNRANWDDRAPIHAAAPDYQVQSFLDDPGFLSGVVRFDQPRLGDVADLEAVHLQCHIGTDTLSLARLGASMTGLDLSGASLTQARRIAAAVGADIDYVESDVYAAATALGGRTFDLVYVSLGALCWLPSVDRWAEVVAGLLRPGGRLFSRDSHPVLDTLDILDTLDGRKRLGLLTATYPYFETTEPVVWDEADTYVGPASHEEHRIEHTTTHSWNHGLGETVTGILRHGLRLDLLEEHDTVPFCPFPGMMTVDDLGEWRMTAHPERFPLSFTIAATKAD